MPERFEGSRLRRTWPQRLLICFNVCAILAALAGAGLVAYGKRAVSQIPRVTITGPGVEPVAELEPGDPQNFLIVGVDSIDGLDPNDPVRDGRDEVAGLRSDTIMVVRIDPKNEKARILSFPRDLWVEIPGEGHNRINSAIRYGKDGGPSLLIATLKVNFGITINHYIQVNFAGFKHVIDQIGGVPLYLTNPVRDFHSGLNLPEAGCVTLDADQSLAYARSRHLQYQVDGRWRRDGSSDLGRISRQQDFTRRVVKRAIDQGARNPATLRRMVEKGVKAIAIDQYTTAEDLITLGRTFRDYDPDELENHSLPVTDATRGGAKVLDLVEEAAEPILELFRGTEAAGGTAADVVPADVTVRARNGSGLTGQGGDTTDGLAAAGFQVRVTGDDLAWPVARTEVRYRTGQEADAMLVARYLDGDPALVPDESVAEITVFTGPDLKGVALQPRPADAIVTTTSTSTTTTSTTPATTTTTSTTPTSDDDPSIDGESSEEALPQGYLPDPSGVGRSCG